MITLGHLLLTGALAAAAFGLWQAVIWLRHQGHGRGTPQYAHGRDSRRFAAWSFALALLLAAGCLTPLCHIAIL